MKDRDDLIKKHIKIDETAYGCLRWISHPSKWHSSSHAGKAVGTINGSGYYQCSIFGKVYLNHRVVFFLSNGFWPKKNIDHIDGNKLNNRPENLRDVEQSTNLHNRICKGYSYNKITGKFHARIGYGGKKYSLGCYETEDEARRAYLKAKEVNHIDFPDRCIK